MYVCLGGGETLAGVIDMCMYLCDPVGVLPTPVSLLGHLCKRVYLVMLLSAHR